MVILLNNILFAFTHKNPLQLFGQLLVLITIRKVIWRIIAMSFIALSDLLVKYKIPALDFLADQSLSGNYIAMIFSHINVVFLWVEAIKVWRVAYTVGVFDFGLVRYRTLTSMFLKQWTSLIPFLHHRSLLFINCICSTFNMDLPRVNILVAVAWFSILNMHAFNVLWLGFRPTNRILEHVVLLLLLLVHVGHSWASAQIPRWALVIIESLVYICNLRHLTCRQGLVLSICSAIGIDFILVEVAFLSTLMVAATHIVAWLHWFSPLPIGNVFGLVGIHTRQYCIWLESIINLSFK